MVLLLSGCSVALFNNYKPASLPEGINPDSYSWFSGDTGRTLFRSSISIYGNDFTGLLLVKPTGQSQRILFITEMGIKIFDMEFYKAGSYSVHYCMEAIDRKPVIRRLGNDFSLMLYSVTGDGNQNILKEKDTGMTVIKINDKAGKRFCKIDSHTGKVEELIQTGILTNKLNINFFGTSQERPDSVIISHYNIKFKIHLATINEN